MLILHRFVYLDFARDKGFRIRPYADFQLGDPDVDKKLVEETVTSIERDPLSVNFGVGDLINADRPSTRKIRVAAYAGRERELSEADAKSMYWLDREVIPLLVRMAGSPNLKRGFGMVGQLDGHHYEMYRSGITSTEYMVRAINDKLKIVDPRLKVKYLGEMMAYIVLHVKNSTPRSKQAFNIVIHAQHGTGSSQFIGTDIGHLERRTTTFFDADVFVRGHSTKRWTFKRPILYPSGSEGNPELLERTVLGVNVGGYLRGYGPGARASYVEAAGMAPVELGHVVIKVAIKWGGWKHATAAPEFSVEY